MFSSDELTGFHDKLIALQRDILQQQRANIESGSTVELDQTSVGRLSRMDAMQGQAMAKANEARLKQKLLDIQHALEKVKTDDFGYCETCDELINLPRLQYDPSVKYCLNCAD